MEQQETTETKPVAKKPVAKKSVKDDGKFAYGVAELAKALGVEPSSARIRLRNGKIKKNGKSYGWKNKTEFDAVVKKLKAN